MKINRGLILANLIVIGLAVVTYLNMNQIQLHYPYTGMLTDDRSPTFAWSGQMQKYELLIDEDPGFGSPLKFDVEGSSHRIDEELLFGTYWWKVRSGGIESEARKFTLLSTVALSRIDPNLIKNSGNTDLLVHRSGITGALTLPVNETLEIGENENVMGEQK